jgi:hypothetical protein
LLFEADGQFKRVGIGPTDTSSVSEGRWQLVDLAEKRIRVSSGEASEELKIVALEPDRLVVSRKS